MTNSDAMAKRRFSSEPTAFSVLRMAVLKRTPRTAHSISEVLSTRAWASLSLASLSCSFSVASWSSVRFSSICAWLSLICAWPSCTCERPDATWLFLLAMVELKVSRLVWYCCSAALSCAPKDSSCSDRPLISAEADSNALWACSALCLAGAKEVSTSSITAVLSVTVLSKSGVEGEKVMKTWST